MTVEFSIGAVLDNWDADEDLMKPVEYNEKDEVLEDSADELMRTVEFKAGAVEDPTESAEDVVVLKNEELVPEELGGV